MMKVKILNAETLDKINEVNLDLVTNDNREYVVGRSSKSGLILDSNDVSRQHGKFYLQDGNYYYCDLDSINGSLINNILAESDRSYLLKPGDIVRIGEFLLVLEEEVEEPEIAATVYNANIDWRAALNVHHPELAIVVSENFAQSLEEESVVSQQVINIDADSSNAKSEEIYQECEVVKVTEEFDISSPDEPTSEAGNVLITDEHPVQDLTNIQEIENSAAPQNSEVESQLNVGDEQISELTIIQAEETTIQPPQFEGKESEVQHNPEVENQLSLNHEQNQDLTTIQRSPAESEDSEMETSISASNHEFDSMTTTPNVEIPTEQALENKIFEVEESSDDSKSNDLETPYLQNITENLEAIAQVAEESEANLQDEQKEEEVTNSQVINDETSQEISQEIEELEVVADIAPQTPEAASKAFEIISKKYIALMAHDSKKLELVDFVAEHQDFLSKCLTIATPTISETIFQQTGLATSQKTPLVPVGGYQTVASLIGTGEALAVILFKDFLIPQSNQANEDALLRLCNVNQILVATNMATAEAIVHYIKDMVSSL
ncbi:methylglyoxal synthase [Calothrix sp. NIES-2100]|uniref:methylglyoxal synthase n=1 Tax=Calothrix sp. NIES-2100 TaxID=1954172 RepID=UPI0030DC6A38